METGRPRAGLRRPQRLGRAAERRQLPLLGGQRDPPGAQRVRTRGQAWASPSTLHRLELGAETEPASDRSQRSAPRCAACDELLGELSGAAQGREPEEV